MSEIKGPFRKGRLLGRWKDRVKENMSETGAIRGEGLEQTKRECFFLEISGGSSAMATPLGDIPGGSEASEL